MSYLIKIKMKIDKNHHNDFFFHFVEVKDFEIEKNFTKNEF